MEFFEKIERNKVHTGNFDAAKCGSPRSKIDVNLRALESDTVAKKFQIKIRDFRNEASCTLQSSIVLDMGLKSMVWGVAEWQGSLEAIDYKMGTLKS